MSYRFCDQQHSKPILKSVKSVSLLLKDLFEVITFTRDSGDLLKTDQWAYGLDIKSKLFEVEMGEKWTNVTWQVTVPKDGNKCLCEWRMNGRLRTVAFVVKYGANSGRQYVGPIQKSETRGRMCINMESNIAC